MKRFTYDNFRVLVSDASVFGGKCPLCWAPLTANVAHECSNGLPVVEVVESELIVEATPDHPAVYRKGRRLVAGKGKGRK